MQKPQIFSQPDQQALPGLVAAPDVALVSYRNKIGRRLAAGAHLPYVISVFVSGARSLDAIQEF